MSDSEFFGLFARCIEWARKTDIVIAEHSFSFFDLWMYGIIATIVFFFFHFITSD
ncbi:MAG: hypothetical protein J6J11_00260 [Treponema sp.]|nr:hypothetical protein [Clostridia bacterium]MBP3606744.1 hypothetical protein [Treponema sp.]